MNRTLHYGLPIFEASDKPSILVDFNQAMQDIDESMFLIAAGGDSHVADAIAALEQGLASVTSQIAIINQTLGTKLDTSFMHNLAAEFDRTMTYFKYDFVFADGNLYQCIEDYEPNSSSFDICFRPVWLCNSVAKTEADLEELSDNYDALETRVTSLENAPGYSLPAATTSTLGGIKVGSGLSISPTGVLDVAGGSGLQLNHDNIKMMVAFVRDDIAEYIDFEGFCEYVGDKDVASSFVISLYQNPAYDYSWTMGGASNPNYEFELTEVNGEPVSSSDAYYRWQKYPATSTLKAYDNVSGLATIECTNGMAYKLEAKRKQFGRSLIISIPSGTTYLNTMAVNVSLTCGAVTPLSA